MPIVDNSWNNREIEYFLSYPKDEFLKNKQTHKIDFNEIKNLVIGLLFTI